MTRIERIYADFSNFEAKKIREYPRLRSIGVIRVQKNVISLPKNKYNANRI